MSSAYTAEETPTATLNVIPGYGATLRLSNRGFPFTSIPMPGTDETDPTDAAVKALTDEGWRCVGPWEQTNSRTWTAQVRPAEEG